MGYMGGVEWESRKGADSLTRQLPTIPKGDKPEKDGGSGGRCEIAPVPPKGDKLEKDGGDYGSGGSDGRGWEWWERWELWEHWVLLERIGKNSIIFFEFF